MYNVLYAGPYFDDKEITAAVDNIKNSNWCSSGSAVKDFEQNFAAKWHQKEAIMVNSGSSANLVAITACKKRYGWSDGDEILVSAVQFPTTITPIVQNNLVCSFVDITYPDLNFNVSALKVTPKTKALLLSPPLGNPPDIDLVVDFCKKNNLVLILDCCDSLGTTWNGKYLSEFAAVSTYSFYAAHHICTLEGGMISSNDAELMAISRRLRSWGRDCRCSATQNLLINGCCGKRFSYWLPTCDHAVDHRYIFTEMGYNLKALDLQGAIGLIQLEKVDEIIAKRKKHKLIIEKIFADNIEGIQCLSALPAADVSWFATPFIYSDKIKLVVYLENHGIQTRNLFSGNILQQPAFMHLGDYKNFPIANSVLKNVFFVGCAPQYTQETFDYIESVLKKWIK